MRSWKSASTISASWEPSYALDRSFLLISQSFPSRFLVSFPSLAMGHFLAFIFMLYSFSLLSGVGGSVITFLFLFLFLLFMVYREEWSDAGYPVSPKKPNHNLNKRILSTKWVEKSLRTEPSLTWMVWATVHTSGLETRRISVCWSVWKRALDCKWSEFIGYFVWSTVIV